MDPMVVDHVVKDVEKSTNVPEDDGVKFNVK